MSAPSISRYPVPKLEDLPEDIRVRILEVQEKADFIPNVYYPRWRTSALTRVKVCIQPSNGAVIRDCLVL
jgi:hypothetical protein